MKIIKAILLTVIGVIALALITALFVKKEIGTEKEVLTRLAQGELIGTQLLANH